MIFCFSSVKIKHKRKLNTVFPCCSIQQFYLFKNRTRVFFVLAGDFAPEEKCNEEKNYDGSGVGVCLHARFMRYDDT